MSYTVYLERFLHVLIGGYPPTEVFREIPIVASVFYYSLTICIARILRTIIRKVLPQPYQDLVGDMVMTFAGCACSLENVMIRNAYGYPGYAAILFIISMWFMMTIRDGSRGNPCANLIAHMKGRQTLLITCSRMVFQLLGGLLSYRYARLFWYLELTKGHGHRFTKLHCNTDLNVATPVGFGLEFSATLLDALLALTTFTPFFVIEMASKVVIGIIMVITGLHTTGMYMNPVNASNQNFGCKGTSTLEHVIVYWCGPLLASCVAVVIHRHMSHVVTSLLKCDVTISSSCVSRERDDISNANEDVTCNTKSNANEDVQYKDRYNHDVNSVNKDVYDVYDRIEGDTLTSHDFYNFGDGDQLNTLRSRKTTTTKT